MANQTVFYVGSAQEVAHHARPLQEHIHVEITSPVDVLAKASPGDLAIFFSEHFDRFRNAIIELKKRKCATLYAIDGILEWRNSWENSPEEPACPWTMRPVLCHKVACIGKSQVRILDGWGNVNKTELVGLPRLERMEHSSRGQQIRSSNELQGTDQEPRRVLIMTAKFPGFTVDQVENARRGLSDLKDWFANNPTIDGHSVQPIWRLTHDMAEQIGVANTTSDLTGRELSEVLQKVDAIITTPSTAMLEGMLTGLPVSLLEFNQCPHLVPAAWQIGAKDQIDNVVHQLLNPARNKMLWQEMLLHDHLACSTAQIQNTEIVAPPDQTPTDRLCDLIAKMQSESKSQLDSDEPLQFPAKMLSASKTEMNLPEKSFQLRQLFPDHECFGVFDTMELQAQLGHARREIDHRQRLLDQALSELAEAHSVLFAIEKHPIAGPVVRARQKLLDWFASRKQKS